MEKQEKNKKMGESKNALSQPGNGNMKAKETTDSLANADASKIKKGAFKSDRYK